MKNLKQILFGAAVALSTLTLVFTSCSKDECEDVTCSNEGTCQSGVCICKPGYEGGTCESKSIDKFIKIWSAEDNEVGDNNLLNYPAMISQKLSDNIFQVEISNFSDYFVNKVGGAVEGNQIIIPAQEPDADGYEVSGTLSYNNGLLEADYSIKQLSSGSSIDYEGEWK